MEPTRSLSKVKQYKRRGFGVMKKADAIPTLIPDIKAAVLFLDGKNLWAYESEDWVSSLSSMKDLHVERMNPTHFRTVFEHQQALAQEAGSALEGRVPPPETSLFVKFTPEPSLLSPATKEMVRQLRAESQALPAPPRRSTRGKKRAKTGTGSHEDIYGFIDVDGGSGNEM